MLRSHFITLLIFCFLVSTVMATLKQDSLRAILRAGAIMMVKMVLGVILVSWVMYLL